MTLHHNKHVIWRSGEKVISSLESTDVEAVIALVKENWPETKIIERGAAVDFLFDDGSLSLLRVISPEY